MARVAAIHLDTRTDEDSLMLLMISAQNETMV
jgi:RNA polymerase sigma-70 factor, ECF subfamily